MLFTEATNRMAYLKAGILGFQGSGKTYTACQVALGFYKYLKATKPIYFLDTETGSDWAVPMFAKAKIPLRVSKTRAFRDLPPAIKEAEASGSFLIIDSISHFWVELLESYQRAHKLTRLSFHHWGPIKQQWRTFSDAYVNSQLHCVVCGRAGWDYDYQEEEDGKKELIKTGTKMRAEGEFGFEPSLLLEMERLREVGTVDGKSVGKIGARVIHRCHIIKDRRMDGESLDGKHFDNPTFDCFLPHIKALNLGGEHFGVDTTSRSDAIFDRQTGESWESVKKRREILMEEMLTELDMLFPGTGKDMKGRRCAILKKVFGTYSETAIAELPVDRLKAGAGEVSVIAGDPDLVEAALAEAIAQGKPKPSQDAPKPPKDESPPPPAETPQEAPEPAETPLPDTVLLDSGASFPLAVVCDALWGYARAKGYNHPRLEKEVREYGAEEVARGFGLEAVDLAQKIAEVQALSKEAAK